VCLHQGLINTGEHEVLRCMRIVTVVRDRLHALIGLIPTAGHSGCEKEHYVSALSGIKPGHSARTQVSLMTALPGCSPINNYKL
jgi:hypothetical protein